MKEKADYVEAFHLQRFSAKLSSIFSFVSEFLSQRSSLERRLKVFVVSVRE